MKFKIITIGKTKNQNILSEINEIQKRIKNIELLEIKEIKDKNIEIIKKKEFEEIKKHLNNNNFNILLWEFGEEFETKKFYDKIKKINQDITFIITGAFGANDELKNLVDFHISLSKMTFTHEMAKLMLIEQLYRVNCFEKNIPYTK